MRTSILAALALTALVGASAVARADDFAGQQQQNGYNAYLDQQATNSSLSDPTARDSIRSHGNH